MSKDSIQNEALKYNNAGEKSMTGRRNHSCILMFVFLRYHHSLSPSSSYSFHLLVVFPAGKIEGVHYVTEGSSRGGESQPSREPYRGKRDSRNNSSQLISFLNLFELFYAILALENSELQPQGFVFKSNVLWN